MGLWVNIKLASWFFCTPRSFGSFELEEGISRASIFEYLGQLRAGSHGVPSPKSQVT